ncbi:hypothetical protein L6R50_27740 [Myxococcota bacterium]|nr:hypothetical protein [Myxococcota bacterium]
MGEAENDDSHALGGSGPAPAAPPAPSPLPSPPPRAVPWVLAGLATVLFAPSLGNGLTNWDDPRWVAQNPFAEHGLAGIPAAFLTPFDGAWYPLTHAAYCAVRAVAGESAAALHAFQIAVFAATAALVPRALGAFGVPAPAAFWAAILWVFHPLRVESVAWAANLKDTLSALFVVASFALLGAGRRRASAATFGAALLSKSTVFPLALLVPLRDAAAGSPSPAALRRGLPWLVPAVLVAIAAGRLHLAAPEAALRSPAGGSVLQAIPTALALPWWYLGRILFPRPSQAIYAFEPVGWLDPRFAAALLMWGALVGLLVARPQDRRPAGIGLAAWILPLVPVTGLVPLAFLVADRYTLLPSLALSAAVALAAAAAATRLPAARVAVALALAAACAGAGGLSVMRQGEWRDGVALWEADRGRVPEDWTVRINLAGAYGGESRWDEAIAELREARRLRPEATRATRDLFFALAARDGMPVDRIMGYLGSLVEAGRRPNALLLVARRALAEGQPAAARVVVEAAMEAGRSAEAHAMMARTAAAQGADEEALAEAREALRLDPARDAPRVDAALALVRLGRVDEALAETATPTRDRMANARLRGVRAYALYRAGRLDEAREVLESVRAELPSLPGLEALIRQLDGPPGSPDAPAPVPEPVPVPEPAPASGPEDHAPTGPGSVTGGQPRP